jgi:hypothetical protein
MKLRVLFATKLLWLAATIWLLVESYFIAREISDNPPTYHVGYAVSFLLFAIIQTSYPLLRWMLGDNTFSRALILGVLSMGLLLIEYYAFPPLVLIAILLWPFALLLIIGVLLTHVVIRIVKKR